MSESDSTNKGKGVSPVPRKEEVLQVERRDYQELAPTNRPRSQSLEGFDDIYTDIVDYIIKDNVFAVDLLAESVCRFLTNHRHHVLIVDDSATARALLSSRLKRYNFRVSVAESGAKALEILKANRDIGLMVTDYNMPDIDGFELTRRIRATIGSHELRIIGVSSSSNRLLSARFLKAGGNDFILRPFIDEEFYCRVNQNLDTLLQIQSMRKEKAVA